MWIDGDLVCVHRVALSIKLGRPIREGMECCHHCHNTLCINPDHLSEGTHSENMLQSKGDGRLAFGDRHPNSKVRADMIQPIRNDPRPYRVIGLDYGISAQTVLLIKKRRNWDHVA